MKNSISFLTLIILCVIISCTSDNLSEEIIIPQKGFIEVKPVDFSDYNFESNTEINSWSNNNKALFSVVKSWEINPSRLEDESLSMYYYNGHLFGTTWFINKYFTNIYPSGGVTVPREVHNYILILRDFSLGGYHGLLPPMVVKFYVKKGVKYRLRFKVENSQYSNNRLMVALNDDYVGDINLNFDSEYIFYFQHYIEEELNIAIGGFYPNYNTKYLKISKIIVEQLEL